ncbi:metallophosphoesterase family protein [Deinococcus sp. SDU3-2]|uniref:Metallophosphoesterase family protein n=1 Tax=Deinococcus terrestris TaxID=2651870 RepID=A0A7X1NSS8_9DEIO|nr:metallophosphoesterase family protein [Deinococcus terrestris]MPY65115.1 metallophosphoesterase family protein [Deinococcus terrestris]
MRLAVFGDIHGNLPALHAALTDMRAQGADAFLCLGDVALGGGWPRDCLAEVAALGCPVVRGNADRMLLEPVSPFSPRGFPDEEKLHEIDAWGHAQLTPADRRLVETYLPVAELPGLLGFHGSPERDDETLSAQTPDARLEALRTASGQHPIWVGGHTHKPLLRTLDGWTLLNPGSIGLPYERRGDRYVNLAQASYLLLGADGQVTFRTVPYDVRAVQQGILASGLPHAGWLAAEWVGT